jgi:drug/metabolite transporter (DMT)-like permease
MLPPGVVSHLGELCALGTAFCWAGSSLAFESASRRAGSLPVNLIRLVIALLLFVLLMGIWQGRPIPTDADSRQWLWLGLSGFVGFFIGDMALFRALVLIGARVTSLLMALAPPFAAVLGAMVLGERLSAVHWAGMAVTLAGVAWVVTERSRGDGSSESTAFFPTRGEGSRYAWGLALGLIAAIGQAGGVVLGKMGMLGKTGNYDPFAATQIRVVAGTLAFSSLLLASGYRRRVAAALKNGRAMLAMTFGAFIGPFLGVTLLMISIQRIPTGVAQTFTALVPVIILPLVVWQGRERVSLRAVAGAMVAVLGVAILAQGG